MFPVSLVDEDKDHRVICASLTFSSACIKLRVNSNSRIKVGIIGGAGFTGGELLRLLLDHPRAEITAVASSSHAGRPVASAHPHLRGLFEK